MDVWLILSILLNSHSIRTTIASNGQLPTYRENKFKDKSTHLIVIATLLLDNICIANLYILSTLLLMQLLISGDIESNPGPKLVDYEDIAKQTCHRPRFISLNAQNLFHKHIEWKQLVKQGPKTIYGISETWFDENVSDSLWTIDQNEHVIFRDDRSKQMTGKAKGGGVLMLVPKNINPVLRTDINSFHKPFFDSLWIECDDFACKRKRQLVCLVYNPSKRYKNIFLADLALNLDKDNCRTKTTDNNG